MRHKFVENAHVHINVYHYPYAFTYFGLIYVMSGNLWENPESKGYTNKNPMM